MKLSKTNIDRIIQNIKSNAALDLLLYMVRLADDSGIAVGIHYAETARSLKISESGFYYALGCLEKAGIIKVIDNSVKSCDERSLCEYGYYSIKILDNDYNNIKKDKHGNWCKSQESKVIPYLNINIKAVHNNKFKALSLNEKKVLLLCLYQVRARPTFALISQGFKRQFSYLAKRLAITVKTAKKIIARLARRGIAKITYLYDYMFTIENLSYLIDPPYIQDKEGRRLAEADIKNYFMTSHFLKIFKADLPLARCEDEYKSYKRVSGSYKSDKRRYLEFYEHFSDILYFVSNIAKKHYLGAIALKKAIAATVESLDGIFSPRKLSNIAANKNPKSLPSPIIS
jgi:DNA-binding Lrp family transcriptional regulator